MTDHNVVIDHRLDRGRAVGATRDGAESREEFAGGKGLGQIVIRADLEADDPIGLLTSRGQHQDRNIGRGADAAKDLKAIESGQHHVEEDGVPGSGQRLLDAIGAGMHGGDFVTERLEVLDQQPAEFFVVIHQQDTARVGLLIFNGFTEAGIHGVSRGSSPEAISFVRRRLRNLPFLNKDPGSPTFSLNTRNASLDSTNELMKTFSTLILPALITAGLFHAAMAWEAHSESLTGFWPKWLKRKGATSSGSDREPNDEPVEAQSYHSLMVNAARQYSFKNYAAALTNYRKVLADEPNNAAALSGEAWSLYHMGQAEQAAKYFQTLLTFDATDSWALEGMSLCSHKGLSTTASSNVAHA